MIPDNHDMRLRLESMKEKDDKSQARGEDRPSEIAGSHQHLLDYIPVCVCVCVFMCVQMHMHVCMGMCVALVIDDRQQDGQLAWERGQSWGGE